ncbi:MAG: peptidylprolyl isomerase [Candidatus Aenigmatarchaeota archaeon]|nr:MAG: peptidylprolyl isomerase [Candidatus Aenigmarchaeota archaeon]
MNQGDFIKIDYVGRVADTNEIFDLTVESIAKKENIYNEKQKYGSVLVVIGAGMVISGVEKELKKMKTGEEREFTVKPEEAFGKRKPELIKILPLSGFLKNKINPVPGIYVTIDGQQAKIQSVTSGRVRADFNHPLAGKTLKYWVKITKHITDTKEKIESLLKHYMLNYSVEVQGNKAIIINKKEIPNPLQKFIKDMLSKWIPEIKTVEFETKENKTKEKL